MVGRVHPHLIDQSINQEYCVTQPWIRLDAAPVMRGTTGCSHEYSAPLMRKFSEYVLRPVL